MVPDVDVLAGWVSRLVRIPSVNPLQGGTGERVLATTLARCFTDLGAAEVILDELDAPTGPPAHGPNVYGHFAGRTDRLVALDIHTDTVTVENMTDPPFDGRIEGGFVWGRGALDTKASMGVICALLESWRSAGLRPEPTLLVVGSVGEEAGGLRGAVRFRSWAEARGLDIDQLVICEPTNCAPIHGHKGAVGLRITVRGVSAHSSTPEHGRNAIVAAARIVLALEAHHHELIARPPSTEVGTGTLLTATIKGGIAGNVVPDTCSLLVGRRIAPYEDPVEEFERITAIARAASPLPIDVEWAVPGNEGSPAFYQSPDSALIRTLATAAGTEATCAPFGTNALRYDGFAREKAIFGPGSIDDAHKATECVAIADLARVAHAYTAWLNPG